MPTGKPSFSWMGIVHRREAASRLDCPIPHRLSLFQLSLGVIQSKGRVGRQPAGDGWSIWTGETRRERAGRRFR